ncbi:MAG TPA: MFS transporter [Solimonas sp.]|nr:MFS transporter [Solimonas sp.]
MSDTATTALPGAVTVPAARSSALAALLLLAGTVAVGRIAQGVFSPLQEMAKHDLQLSDFEVSLVQGLAASIPVAVLSIPLGRMVDHANRVRLLLAMAVVWTLGTLLTAVVQDFTALFAARTLSGIGMMCSLPVAISIAADLSAADRRGRSLLLLSVGSMFGAAAAFVFGGGLVGWVKADDGGWFGDLAPWRSVHLLIGLGSALWLLPLLLLREPVRQELGSIAAPSIREAMAAIWQRRRLLAPLFIGQTSVVMADASAGIWAAPVLIRDYGLTPEQFGPWMGAVVVLSGLIGSVIGGVAADLGHKGRLRGGMLGPAVVAALCSLPATFFALMPTPTGFALMLFVLLICGSITGLVTSTAIAVLVPNEIRGICLGAFIVVGSLFGIGMAPTLVTLISSALGGESHVREGLTLLVLFSSLASAIGFTLALRGRVQTTH